MEGKVTDLLKVVTLGGGTGSYMLLKVLVRYTKLLLTGICTVFDNGGSTGDLRDAYGTLPAGDLRRVCAAMAGGDKRKREAWRNILSFRIPPGIDGLANHSLGNLILLAVEKMGAGRLEGINTLCHLMDVKGRPLPISLNDAHLCAELEGGELVVGETLIDTRYPYDVRGISRVYLEPEASILPEAAKALREADIIILGPGDHFTSLMPNVLVKGFAEAVSESSAKLVYVANLMTKAAETRGYTLVDFAADFIERYGVGREKFDAIIYNTKLPPKKMLAYYQEVERAVPVEFPVGQYGLLEKLTNQLIEGDFLSKRDLKANLVRHDGQKVAQAILSL